MSNDPFTPADPNQPEPSSVPIVTDVPEQLPPLQAPPATEPQER